MLYFCTRNRDGSSVGLERMLDRHEVTSSILVRPTMKRRAAFFLQRNRVVSPVGLERCLHTAEVTGSSPVRPTKVCKELILMICKPFLLISSLQ